MDLRQLIAAPLIATVEADSMAVKTYLDFLAKVAFEPNEKHPNSLGKLRMLSFSYVQSDTNGARAERQVNIPILSLVLLPLLQVKEADFDFDVNILEAVSEASSQTFSFSEKPKEEAGPEEEKLSLRASIAPKSGGSQSGSQSSLAANIKVHVRMQQADMPAGLTNLLGIAAGGLSMDSKNDEQNE
jgi:hypothetical protein